MIKKPRIKFLDYLQYLSLRGVAGVINALPAEFADWLIRRFADFFYMVLPMRRKVALGNLDIAFKDSMTGVKKRHIARQAFRNLAVSLMELFRIPSMLKMANERFQIEGTEHLDRAFARGKGVIFVVSHLGSWEYLEFLFYLRKYPCSVVVREIKNNYIYHWIQELRAKTTVHPIDRIHSVKEILRTLKKNKLIAILIDQWASDKGLWVDFFGEKTSTTSIPVRLAHKTGAALIPGYCVRMENGYYKIVVEPEVLVDPDDKEFETNTTVKLNQRLEKAIRLYPEQWTWTHRRWKGAGRYRQLRGELSTHPK